MSLTLLLCLQAQAQTDSTCRIQGVVRDSASGSPLENVNVFLASTTIGTGTGSDGHFVLKSVPVGSYQLVFSRVGYRTRAVRVEFTSPSAMTRDMQLAPRMVAVGEVEISSNYTKWRKQLAAFLNVFLGQSQNAERCRLTNPEALDFQTDSLNTWMTAVADQPLIIENRALGYRVQVSLSEFRWNIKKNYGYFLLYPRFMPLRASTPGDSVRWLQSRWSTYERSLRHFLASLVAGTWDQSTYRLFEGSIDDLQQRLGKQLHPEDLSLKPVPGTPYVKWSFDGWLRVEQAESNGLTTSYIRLNEPAAFIDRSGLASDPLCIGVLGYWEGYRVADMLPTDVAVPSR